MYVIVLLGNPDSGKSQTLNIVYQLLLFNDYVRLESAPAIRIGVPEFPFRVLGKREQRDFMDILVKNSKIVGFATMGDFNDVELQDSIPNLLLDLSRAGCATAVCACSIDGDYEDVLREIRGLYPVTIVNKSVAVVESIQRVKNGTDAKKIFELI